MKDVKIILQNTNYEDFSFNSTGIEPNWTLNKGIA